MNLWCGKHALTMRRVHRTGWLLSGGGRAESHSSAHCLFVQLKFTISLTLVNDSTVLIRLALELDV